jgi:hypothetical protein
MSIRKQVNQWLADLAGRLGPRREEPVHRLRATSEHDFDSRNARPEERQRVLDILKPPAGHAERAAAAWRTAVLACAKPWDATTENILRRLLADSDPAAAVAGVWACGRMGSHAAVLLPELLRHAQHGDREIRWRVPWAISRIRPDGAAVAQRLLPLLEDRDDTVRMYAVDAVTASSGAPDIRDAVARKLADPAGEVRAAACRGLARLGDSRATTFTELRKLVETDLHGVALEAAYALAQLGDNVLEQPGVRSWLEQNRGYWWVDELFENAN